MIPKESWLFIIIVYMLNSKNLLNIYHEKKEKRREEEGREGGKEGKRKGGEGREREKNWEENEHIKNRKH